MRRGVTASPPARISTASEAETLRAGAQVAAGLRPGDSVLLQGGLGAGKTVFVRGAAGALGVNPSEVRSPTFTLVNIYAGRSPVYHIDLYRIDKPGDLTELGLEEFIGTDGVAMVEWSERLGRYTPASAVRVWIEDRGANHREILVWDERDPDPA